MSVWRTLCVTLKRMTHVHIQQAVNTATASILRRLVRILLRYGIGYQAFCEIAKRSYIEVAQTDFALPGKKQTVSRISTLTGLSRKEVSRVSQLPEPSTSLAAASINRAARVVSGWLTDDDYLDAQAQPLDLPFEGEGSFTALVKRHSGDIPPRTIADELNRTGTLVMLASGHVRLQQNAYVPKTDDVQNLQLLGTDVADLIATMDHNRETPEAPYFQRKVCYQNIDPDVLENVRTSLSEQAQNHLESLQQDIIKHAKVAKGSRQFRLGVGIYYFEEEVWKETT